MNYLQMKKKAMLNYVSGITPPLPSEYQQVEWIKANSGAYIDTTFYPTNNSKVVIDGQYDQLASVSIFGVNPLFAITTRNTYYTFRINNQTITTNTVGNIRKIMTMSQKDGAYLDDTLVGTFTQNAFASLYSALLFARRTSGGGIEEKSNSQIYSCKLYESENLERDYVPCYRKADDVIGMYDIVNDTFYTNAGSGTFTKGQDV